LNRALNQSVQQRGNDSANWCIKKKASQHIMLRGFTLEPAAI
jgi:hypothetical protein